MISKFWRNEDGWKCEQIIGKSRYGTIFVEWVSGPLKGKKARIEAKGLKACAAPKS